MKDFYSFTFHLFIYFSTLLFLFIMTDSMLCYVQRNDRLRIHYRLCCAYNRILNINTNMIEHSNKSDKSIKSILKFKIEMKNIKLYLYRTHMSIHETYAYILCIHQLSHVSHLFMTAKKIQ